MLELGPFLITDDLAAVHAYNAIADLPQDGSYEVVLQKVDKGRTTQQNKAIFKYFRLMAAALADAGYTARTFFGKMRDGFEVPPTYEDVRKVAENVSVSMFQKPIKHLTTVEIQQLYEAVNSGFSTTHGVGLPFPSKNPPPFGG